MEEMAASDCADDVSLYEKFAANGTFGVDAFYDLGFQMSRVEHDLHTGF